MKKTNSSSVTIEEKSPLRVLVCVLFLLNVVTPAVAADFDADAQDVWLSPSTVYQGQTADIYARFKNLSSLSGPYGGYAQFDLRIIVYPPSGGGTYRCTSLKPSSGDSYEFSPSQTKDFYWDNYTFSEVGQYTVKAEIWQNNAYSSWNTSTSTRFDYRQESFNVLPVNHAPSASRENPSSSTISITQGTQAFVVRGTDQDGNLDGVEWYVDGQYQENGNLSGSSDTDSFSYNFTTVKTYIVEATVFDTDGVYSNPAAMWTVSVEPDNYQPDQPTFESVPSSAKLYPYTSRPDPDPDSITGPYTVVVDYTDPDGRSDLQHVYLQIQGDGTSQTIMYYNMTTPQQWSGEGNHLYNIGANKSSITDGYRVTYTFQMKSTWTPSKNVDFEAWALDDSDVESNHRSYNWNGIYDNDLAIHDAHKNSLVDNDGDGYYSSVRIEANADTSVSSRTVKMILYRRDSDAGGSGTDIWNTGDYTTSGTSADYRGTDCTVTTKGVYDFAWELYDPSWYITNRWYDTDADISNIQMEFAEQDIAYTVNGTLDFPSLNNLRWNKIDWGWNAGLLARNATTSDGVLTLAVEPTTGLGAQIVHNSHGFGSYSARIKAVPPTSSPDGVCQGFFYYKSDTEEIDVELLSAKPGYAYFTVQGGETFRVAIPNQSTQYHEYGFKWSDTSVQFYLDGALAVGDRVIAGGTTASDTVLQAGVQAIAVTNIPQLPGSLIINNWSGNNWAGYPPTTRLEMKVDDVSWPEKNHTPTDIGLSNLTVQENQPQGTVVGQFSTTDPDTGDTFTYTLVSGAGSTDNASFTIAGDQLKTDTMFDYETKSSYSIRARTTDQGGLWYEEAFTINVIDVAEPPSKATNPSPSNGATNQSINVDASWSNGGGATSYNVYFGTDNPPTNIENGTNQAETTYDPGTLNYSTIYYWRINAKNSDGTTTGDVWSFTTELEPTPPESFFEDFETGDFSKHSWVQGCNAPWIITSSVVHEGTCAAQSGAISDDQQSCIELTKNVPAGYITFSRKVSSEEQYDWLIFYIDDSLIGLWSGEMDWTKKSYFIEEGTHTFRWAYEKDVSLSTGSDCGWIDDIVFEPEPVDCALYCWADFHAYSLVSDMTVTPNGNFAYDWYYDDHWVIYGSGGGFTATFNSPADGQFELVVRHLSSASAGCPGGGYSPVTIKLNGDNIVSCYDPAENHGGTHGFVTDTWLIPVTTGTNTLEWIACDLCTNYWIQGIEIRYPKELEGDLDCDSVVDFNDVGMLTAYWLEDCATPNWCGGRDIDKSGSVNFTDFALLAQNWLAGVTP